MRAITNANGMKEAAMRPAYPAAFAIPGDLTATTGGYHYDRCLMDALRTLGHDVTHIALPDGFPFPTAAEMTRTAALLADAGPGHPMIIDGLAFGALETDLVDGLDAPIVALVHHPLAHESGMEEGEARRLHALEKANLARAAHVIVPSGYIRDVLMSDYAVPPNRVSVIRPGRPDLPDRPKQIAHHDHTRSAGGAAEGAAGPGFAEMQEPPLILSVGLLHPRKGHDVLIDALARITDLDWRAVIVGAPWEPGHQADLARRIERAGLGVRITLAGRVPRQELDRLYDGAHLFALATRFEGYGIVFDEALMRGLPIVSTRAGAVPGTVPKSAGRLVAPDDACAFAGALRDVLEDREMHGAMSRAAAGWGAALPDWTDAANAAARILSDVMDRSA